MTRAEYDAMWRGFSAYIFNAGPYHTVLADRVSPAACPPAGETEHAEGQQ